MGSQFVDLNADGHLDYLSATFDGSPHVSYGSAKGFAEPVRLKDAQGQRILITAFWNYDDRAHQTTGRSMMTDDVPKERCISALAFDWDADGDLDLLLGSYENGHLYRQMNEGTNAKPKFTGKNIPVMAGSSPFALPSKMTTPRLVDWDGDGDLDLIAGSFGDSYSQKGKGGGVYLSLNQGKKGQPAFATLQTLIAPSPKGAKEPTRPDAGLYPEAVDYDGDGDLDLVVGGYSMWTPQGRTLTNVEMATISKLRQQQKVHQKRQSEFFRTRANAVAEATAGLDRKSDAYREKRAAIYAGYNDQASAMRKQTQAVTKKLNALVPGPQRRSFVWLYERL
ncbi:MAG: hypothetical protein CMJ83_17595 [Planctomycetes bacterium]|nr:hypothetical protein [Planctomycetota bacterium]